MTCFAPSSQSRRLPHAAKLGPSLSGWRLAPIWLAVASLLMATGCDDRVSTAVDSGPAPSPGDGDGVPDPVNEEIDAGDGDADADAGPDDDAGSSECPLASDGCPCTAGGYCDGDELTCGADDICVCTPGTLGCECDADDMCELSRQCHTESGMCVCRGGEYACPCAVSDYCTAPFICRQDSDTDTMLCLEFEADVDAG